MDESQSEIVSVDPKNLHPSPIAHDSLPPRLLEMVEAIYEQLGPYLGMTLREFEVGFMRDACPEREIWLWVRITNAWLDYHVQHLNSALLAPDKEEELVTALIHISCGCIHITNISGGAEAGKRLVDCYRKTASN